MGAPKGGKSSTKGKSGARPPARAPVREVYKPALKQSAPPLRRPVGSLNRGSSSSSGYAPRASSYDRHERSDRYERHEPRGGKGARPGKGFSRDAPKGAGKGRDRDGFRDRDGQRKGKGKGKGKRAAPLASKFWEHKVESENRVHLEGQVYTGVVQRYLLRTGYGFITPDEPDKLPKKVKAKLQRSNRKLESDGKVIDEPFLLYFRKPDVYHGFKIERDAPVTFEVYVDDMGAGACEIRSANEEEGGEEWEDMDEEHE